MKFQDSDRWTDKKSNLLEAVRRNESEWKQSSLKVSLSSRMSVTSLNPVMRSMQALIIIIYT